jgi:hypothetical protein
MTKEELEKAVTELHEMTEKIITDGDIEVIQFIGFKDSEDIKVVFNGSGIAICTMLVTVAQNNEDFAKAIFFVNDYLRDGKE